jgi:hypothetical protein
LSVISTIYARQEAGVTFDAVAEKKKKQPLRRRWRVLWWIIGVILLISAAGAVLQPWLKPYLLYQEALRAIYRQEKFYSPDGRRFAITSYHGFDSYYPGWLVDEGAGKAYQLGYPENSFTGVQWSADSRFAILNGATHYGASNLTIFDMEQGRQMPVPGDDVCDMFPMSVCNGEVVIVVASVSPLIITASGTVIHLPDGAHHNMISDMHTTLLQAAWSPSERRLFWLAIQTDSTDMTQAVLVGYFAGREGENPIQAITLDFDGGIGWFYNDTIQRDKPAFCAWNADELAVECEIDGQRYSLIDPESE